MHTTADGARIWGRLALAGLMLGAACSGAEESRLDSSAGAVAADTMPMTGTPDAVGPAAQVTQTDFGSVRKAQEYQLTAENFSRFMAATDSLIALKARDPQVRQYLERDISGAGAEDLDAGLRYLQAQPAVVSAIESNDISVTDYFIAAIAIASAKRFVDNPSAAPPTPATQGNAEFLRTRSGDLERLTRSRAGMPAVVSKG